MMPELGFGPDDNDRLVASYSGGWQMRMCLGKILLKVGAGRWGWHARCGGSGRPLPGSASLCLPHLARSPAAAPSLP